MSKNKDKEDDVDNLFVGANFFEKYLKETMMKTLKNDWETTVRHHTTHTK